MSFVTGGSDFSSRQLGRHGATWCVAWAHRETQFTNRLAAGGVNLVSAKQKIDTQYMTLSESLGTAQHSTFADFFRKFGHSTALLTPGAAKVLYCAQTFGQSAVLCANFSKVWTQHSTFDLGTGPGVSGSCGEFRVFGRRRRGRFGGPRGDFLVYTKHRIQA